MASACIGKEARSQLAKGSSGELVPLGTSGLAWGMRMAQHKQTLKRRTVQFG
jgi:hypothetical protein